MSLSWSALHAQLVRSSERLTFQRSFDLMRVRQPALLGFRDPPALLDFQHAPGEDGSARNMVLRALVAEASETGDTATTLLLLALWPGFDAVHGRLRRFYWREPDQLVSDLISGITVGIHRLDLSRVTWVAATLVRNAERDTRRRLQREWQRDRACEPVTEDLPHPAPGPGIGHSAELLRDRLQRIIGADADLVIAIAVEGGHQGEAAERFGLGYDAARKRYQRALKRLRTDFGE